MSNPFRQKATAGGGGDFPVPPKGNWPAVLVAMIDLGTQEHEYKEQKRESRDVFLVWEVETTEGEDAEEDSTKSFFVGRDYTLSLNEKANFRKIVSTLRGKEIGADEEYDCLQVLGKGCMIELEHKTSQNERTYAKIKGVSSLPRKLKAPEPTHKPFSWAIGDSPEVLDPEWLPRVYGQRVADVIALSAERRGKKDRPLTENGEDFPHGANAPAGAEAF